MTEATAPTPRRSRGPRWQRVGLVLIGLWGALMVFLVPAGGPAITGSAVALVLAGAVALAGPGNARYKQTVLIGLAALLVLAVISVAWA